jgi:hypothetical protein
VKRGAAHELNVEVAQSEGPDRCLANRRKGFWQQVVERLALLVAFPEVFGLVPQLLVCEVVKVLLESIDGLRVRVEAPQNTAFSDAEDLFEN